MNHRRRRPHRVLPRLRRGLTALLPYLKPERSALLLALGAVLAASAVALLRPWPLKYLVDDVLKVGSDEPVDADYGIVAAVVASLVALAVLQGMFGYVQKFWLSGAGERIASRVRSATFQHLQRLSLTFHDRQRTGDLVTRVTGDISRAQELVLDDLLVTALARSVQVVGMVAVMLVIDWPTGLVAATAIPATVLTSLWFRRRIRGRSDEARDREGDIASTAQETITSIRTVKAFGRHQHTSQRFDDASGDMMHAGIAVARLEAAFGWTLTAVSAVSLAAVIAVGTVRVVGGALTAGTLIVFIQYMRDLQSPLVSLSRLQAKLAKASVRAERVLEVIEQPVTVADRPTSRPLASRLEGHVEFREVTFGYTPDRLVLEGVDLVLAPGEVVAISGPSGVGKSTLASLMLRLYDPQGGSVLVDGTDVRDITLDTFVEQTAVVLQETMLFRASITENIAYGRPTASEEEIRAAARRADADAFIRRLPDGYDSIVGERGTTLSGGQRQRIAIARALVRDAAILVLDEPTTGLDEEAERAVLSALEELLPGRTTLLIAHAPEIVARADRVVLLQNRRLVPTELPRRFHAGA